MNMHFKAVIFDFIGTTVLEKNPDTVARCFERTFQEHGIKVNPEFIQENRGKNKREVIQRAIQVSTSQEKLISQILSTFERNIEESLTNFSAAPDAIEVFKALHDCGIKIGLGTGLTRDSFEKIVTHLQWHVADFDYTATSEEIGKGRPHPDMIFDMMKRLHIKNSKEILKVGDTVSDIQEGKNAGTITVAILSGTQSKETIQREKPDFIFTQLREILKFFN